MSEIYTDFTCKTCDHQGMLIQEEFENTFVCEECGNTFKLSTEKYLTYMRKRYTIRETDPTKPPPHMAWRVS